jgi:hypothetical protein
MADRRDVDSHRDSLAYRSLDVLSRYKMNGLIVDLDEAVDLTLEAARMTKGIYIPLIHSLPNISIILDESFKETAATKHLIGKSIETAGMGEARARGYYFLSCFLQHRSEQTRSLLDLEKAITATRQSVD